MSATDPTRAVRDEFLAAYGRDLDDGRLRSLADYQRMFPGHEDDIADEWSWLEPGDRLAAGTGEVGAEPIAQLGPYRIVDVLGRGAQATVYRAEHESLRRTVALKVLHTRLLLDSENALRRFRREAEATAQLEHPGICSIFETGQTDGSTWIAMQYVAGEPLSARLRRAAAARDNSAGNGALVAPLARSGAPDSKTAGGGAYNASTQRAELQRVLQFFEGAARAIHVAHEHGFVHRDIKPSNLMVAEDGRPVILDFGLAHVETEEILELTRTTDVLGTPYYMAPEQLREGAPVSRTTDVWGLGVTLYECLAGVRPFDGTSRERLFQRILRAEPAPLQSHRARVPHDLEVVLQTALSKEPAQRYQTAFDLAEDLRRVRSHEPILARETPAIVRAWRLVRRHPLLASSLAISLLSILAVLVVTLQSQAVLQNSLKTTRALGLASSARDAVATAPTRALLLALEAIEREDRTETRSALYQALAATRELRSFPIGQRVLTLDVRSDGSKLVVGTVLGGVQLWALTGELLAEWRVDDGGELSRVIMRVAFLGEDRVLVASRTGILWLLDADLTVLDRRATGREFSYHSAVQFRPGRRDEVVMALDDALWIVGVDPAGDRIQVRDELPHSGVDGKWALSADREFLATASSALRTDTGRWFRRDADSRYVLGGPLLPAAQRIGSLAFSGSRLAIGSIGGSAICRDLITGAVSEPLADGAQVCWLSPDRLVTGSLGGQPRLYRSTGLEFERIAEADDRPSFLKRHVPVATSDGRLFAVAYQDGVIRVFDRDGQPVTELIGHSGMPQGLAFLPDSRELLSWDTSVRLWATQPESERPVGWGRLMVSPDAEGSRLLAGGKLRAGDTVLAEVRDQGEWSQSLAPFTSDGRFVASRSDTLRVVATATGDEVFRLPDADSGPWCVLPNSTEILLFDHRLQRARTVDFVSGRVAAGPPTELLVWRVTPSPDGSRVTVGARPGIVIHFARNGGGWWQETARAELGLQIRNMAYSPDGKILIVGTDSGAVVVYDAELENRRDLRAHRQGLIDLAFSRCGRFFATLSIDGSCLLWRADGALHAELRSPSAIRNCAFSPDGVRLMTVHRDGILRSWPVDTSSLIEDSRQRSSRGFTAAEREQFADLLQDG